MKSVALHNLGCKVNGYEMDVMQQKLQEKGYKIVSFDEAADIYIINTCTVTNIADRKSRQMLHRAKKLNPSAVVVAAGCYVQTSHEQALKDMSIDLLIGNNRKAQLIPILEEFLENREKEEIKTEAVIDINQTSEYESMMLTKTAEHTRAFIKIQDGCNQFCSYCIIPYARGRVRSRNRDEILQEVRGLADKGCKEIVLTGIHISSYGTDLKSEQNLDQKSGQPGDLCSLVEDLAGVKGIERIRLGSLEPRIITEDFVKRISGLSKVCPHFHLSLQSGCDETLKRMNRRYTAEEYAKGVELLRSYYDNPAITTDVIVGFPGETDEEFEATKTFISQMAFYELHVFQYSVRKGTPAATMKNQVPEHIKKSRSHELLALTQKMSVEYRKSFLGKKTSVLMEEQKTINGRLYEIGYTREYIRAAVEADESLEGQFAEGTLDSFLQPDIILLHLQHCTKEANRVQ